MYSASHLPIPHSHIALFGSGNSIHDISKEDFETIKANTFVITLNYAPIHLNGHLNIWSDRKVSDFLQQHYHSKSKDCLLMAQDGRVPSTFKHKIDYWFDRKKENLLGNYTIVWVLQLLQKYFPDKIILLFGVDLYAKSNTNAKWYDDYTDFDLKKRSLKFNINNKLNQCGLQFRQFIKKEKVYNCNLKSRLQYFEKKDWRDLISSSSSSILLQKKSIQKYNTTIQNKKIKKKKILIPKVFNIFICLVHEQEDCVLDMIRNLRYLDPSSKIILYNGSNNPNLLQNKIFYQQNEVLIHPYPTPQKHGYLHGFAIDCMQLAVDHFDFEIITNVDSDQLALKKGYSKFIANFLKGKKNVGLLSNDPKRFTVENSPKKMVIKRAFQEYNLWQPLLKTFPHGEKNFAHWTFWPSTVFTKKAVIDLLTLFRKNSMLKKIMAKTKIWATEEVIFPSLIKLMGYDILRNPCSDDFVKYRVKFDSKDLLSAFRKEDSFWIHPINREYNHHLRKRIRESFKNYASKRDYSKDTSLVDKLAPSYFFDLGNLIQKAQAIKGWLNEKEAMLLASITLQAGFNSGKSSSIVEIGCFHGKFTLIIASIIKAFFPKMKVFCIDPHDGKIGEQGNIKLVPPSYEYFTENIKKNNLDNFVVSIRDYSINIKWNKPITLLVIDGLHDYENVRTDFNQFAKKIITKGFIIFHDYSKHFPGVVKFVNELLHSFEYKTIKLESSLIVLQKVKQVTT